MSGRCGVAKVISMMTEEDVKAFKSLLNAPISAAAVSRELESAQFLVNYQIIYRHRIGLCSCEDK